MDYLFLDCEFVSYKDGPVFLFAAPAVLKDKYHQYFAV